jgi:hypothetical protein
LEYILLFVIAVGIGAALYRITLGTQAEPAGIRSAWTKLLQAIGADSPD